MHSLTDHVTEWCCSLIVAYTKWLFDLFQQILVIYHAWF
jgi:hypothetical protein